MTTPITPADTRRQELLPEQRWARGNLVDHTHRLELRGSPDSLAWPRVCANCGAMASEQIRVEKAFRPRPSRHGGSTGNPLGRFSRYRIAGAPIPFCATCAHEHRSTVERPSRAGHLFSLLFHPLIIPVIGGAYFAKIAFDSGDGFSLATPGALFGWGIAALFAGASLWSLYLLWTTTRPNRLERRTEITLACDFSEDVSQVFEGERRIYAMRNKAFADALGAANQDRLWTGADQARSRKLYWTVTLATLGLLLAFGVWYAITQP